MDKTNDNQLSNNEQTKPQNNDQTAFDQSKPDVQIIKEDQTPKENKIIKKG